MRLKSPSVLVLLVIFALMGTPMATAQDQDFLSYDPAFRPTPVRIVPEEDLDKVKAPFVVARLKNGKLALMARDATGRMAPFFVKGIETGFWDTRGRGQKTDWDEVFSNYRKLGANVSLFMLHWKDIEPEEGRFTFDFSDEIVNTARRYGVRIWWVFFMHDNGQLRRGRDFWVFNYDNRGSANYAVQWVKDENGNILDSFDKIRATQAELLPCYAHPKIFAFQNRVIRQLARRYRDSNAVIGMQTGNEEGFIPNVPLNREVDVNPYTLKFYEDWKAKTGKSDWNAFKFNAVAWWWRHFTTSFHAEDPYKLTSFNLWGAFGEQGRTEVIRSQGADHTIYALGNLDVIGSMFYRDEARAVWPNLDAFYLDYIFNLPILLPSEIGIGGEGPHTEIVGGSKVIFQEYTINALERGAHGYSAYCYGQMMDDNGRPDAYAEAYRKLTAMVTAVEDILHPGVPGPGGVAFSTGAKGAKISHLNRPDGATVGILRFPEAAFDNQAPDPSRVSFVADQNTAKFDLTVEVGARKEGNYKLEVFRDGELAFSKSATLKAGQNVQLDLTDVRATEAVFLKATPRTGRITEPKKGIPRRGRPLSP
ncbi:MAG TPA: beta-galactosidase [Acidobacteriota bacterium]|nr:beta-galactosidase [Acidobacteriota bacterium]